MSNHLTDAQYAAFIDRLIACRQAEDDAKEDTKRVYAELAEAGEDKTAAGLIVRGLRMTAKDRTKANLRDAAVENGMERYNRGKASHVRVREASIPDHDAETGEVIEHGSRAKAAHAVSREEDAGERQHSSNSGKAGADEPGRQTSASADADPALNPRASRNGVDGTSEGQGATGAGTEGASPSTGSTHSEPETIPPVADPATVVSEAGGGDSAPSLAAIPVADRSQPNPICRDPDDCGVYASWAMPCQACKAAAAHRSAA